MGNALNGISNLGMLKRLVGPPVDTLHALNADPS
jgi:hypothetical protein